MSTTIAQDAERLRQLREARDEATAAATELKQQYDAAERELFERMRNEELDGFKHGGINFVPAATTYSQVQDRAAFVAWAEEHEPELLERKERKQLLNQLVRERIDNGEPLPPGLGFYVEEYVSQRAA